MASDNSFIKWKGAPNIHPALSTKTTRLDLTGSWRYMKPLYDQHLSPCNHGCPAGNDVRGFLENALHGDFDAAYSLILETSPFPSVCGRVCYHPCETACNRAEFDEAIAIHSIERYVGDKASSDVYPKRKEDNGKKIAIVGAGPAGLSCAYQLTRLGYECHVFDANEKAGGMLRYGIPDYRLPQDILQREIDRIEQLGVKIHLKSPVNAKKLDKLHKDYDALFVAIGAHGEQKMQIEGEDLKGISSGLEFLKQINRGEKVKVSGKVMVVGGGNTAIDVARSAKRLGAKPMILYRRTENEMPAHPDEVREAREEGIEITFLAAPLKLNDKNGKVTSVECQKMELGEPDSSGRRRPVPISGETFIIDVDQIFTAIGEKPELETIGDKIEVKWNRIKRDKYGRTSVEKIFSGGDASLNAGGTVVAAIGDGNIAAKTIDNALNNRKNTPEQLPVIVKYENLNVDYFDNAPRVNIPHEPPKNRMNFSEVVHTLDEEDVITEAERCFSCGVCNYCFNCLKFCPDSAISLKDDILVIDYNYCKGCGICVEECPRFAMSFEEEL